MKSLKNTLLFVVLCLVPSTVFAQAPVRAAGEEAVLLGGLFANYLKDHDINSRDWDYQYTMKGAIGKFGLGGTTFDTNGFATNFKMHPIAGYFYYNIARSNDLSPAVSFLYSFTASLFWEYFVEFREKASINDILVTPIGGYALGEANYMIAQGLRCARNMPTAGRVLWPLGAAHEAWDNKDQECLALTLDATVFATFTMGSQGSMVGLDGTIKTRSKMELTDELKPEANAVDFMASAYWGSWTVDQQIKATIYPWAWRSNSVFIGVPIAFDTHTVDWPKSDRYTGLQLPGLFVSKSYGHFKFQALTSLVGAGIDSWAYSTYSKTHDTANLASILWAEKYTYAGGFLIEPAVVFSSRSFETGLSFYEEQLMSFTVGDRWQNTPVSSSEARQRSQLWMTFGEKLKLRLRGIWYRREGTLGDTTVVNNILRADVSLGVML